MTEVILPIGFSPCPNDTFMFHALVHGDVSVPGYRFAAQMADIEALNLRALRLPTSGQGTAEAFCPRLPLTKLSVTALARLCDDYSVLTAGAALGRACGPLIVARSSIDLGALSGRVAIPGEYTTAHLLLRIFAPRVDVVVLRFDEIMHAVEQGVVDAGLIIHESRFTYSERGLTKVADLGELWEASSGLPLPLGLIAASRSLGGEVIEALGDGLRRSIELARAEPLRSRAWIREHAQEMSDQVCDDHIALYVNDYSVELGAEGTAAVDELIARGRAAGLLPAGRSPWL